MASLLVARLSGGEVTSYRQNILLKDPIKHSRQAEVRTHFETSFPLKIFRPRRGPGRFLFTKKFWNFRLGCKWNTTFWFVPLEIFRNKRNIWKGSPFFLGWNCPVIICVPFTNFSSFSPVSSLPRYFSCFASTKILHQNSQWTIRTPKSVSQEELLASQMTAVVGLFPWFELFFIKLLCCLLPFWTEGFLNSSIAIEYLILTKFREYLISRKVKRHISRVLNFVILRGN